MSKFKIKFSIDNDVIMKKRAESIEELEDVFNQMKLKFGGKKK